MAIKTLCEDVLEMHLDQIQRYGGDPGIRDQALLESALATPQATFGGEFLHQDLFAMAGAYLFHIAKNHPFIDGNKRTASVAALVFLEFNGYEFNAAQGVLADFVLKLASGESAKMEAHEFLKQHCRKITH